MMDFIAPILSAAGVGAVVGGTVTSSLQSWLSRRAALDDRRFREKKEACSVLFNALHKATPEGGPDTLAEVGYARALVDLMGS